MKRKEERAVGALGENYEENVATLKRLLRTEQSFDMLSKRLVLEGGELTLFFIDGFAKDTVLQKLMMHFLSLKSLPKPLPSISVPPDITISSICERSAVTSVSM